MRFKLFTPISEERFLELNKKQSGEVTFYSSLSELKFDHGEDSEYYEVYFYDGGFDQIFADYPITET